MKYVMGIDQGSSKTHVIVGDEQGNILGFGKSYGACHSNTGIEYAMGAVREAMEEALSGAGLSADRIDTAAAGMTGVDWDFEGQLLGKELKKLISTENIVVVNDCIIAMRAGSSHSYGAVLCAGSGLNCAVRDKLGNEFVYGFYIDEDYQGGSALGRACVRAVINAQVGMEEETAMTQMLLKRFGCGSVDALLYKRVTGELTDRDYLSLPILLEEAAHNGDKVAKKILYRFGSRFGRYVAAALERMRLTDCEMEVVLSGSIFKCKEPELRQGVTDYLMKEAPLAKTVDAVYEPIVGAFLLALEKCGSDMTDVSGRIEKWSRRYPLKRLD